MSLKTWPVTSTLLAIGAGVLLSLSASPMTASEPEWGPSRVKECNRECLVGFMDGYMNAIYKHDPKAVPPLAIDVRMTENTGRMEVGEGVLWRSKVEPTPFMIYVADPVTGQVALQSRLMIQGRNALVAVRLKVDRGQISEIEQLYDRNINDAAIPLLTTPRPGLVTDIPPSERSSREVLAYAANSYFDALEGDDGKIAAFADDCVRHENGYQTVNNPPPGGRMMPAPPLPNPDTAQGKEQLRFSMLSCQEQINSKIFAYMKHIRPRHAIIVDQQKGVATIFCLFVHDGTRRGAAPDAPPGMLMNAMIVESFGLRGGKIHEVEAMPFVTIPYGLGDGWTPGSGR
jgi:hypothetical protein